MSLVPYIGSSDPKLTSLAFRLRDLESDLSSIKISQQAIGREHSQKCSESLNESLISLTHLIEAVEKTDRTLIYWVEKGKPVKLILRCVGVDKRTTNIVAKKTEKIKGEVEVMEKAFTETGKVFKNGLNAVQSLNKRVTAYSSGSIGQLQGDANDVLQEYDDEMTKLRSNIRVKQVECASIESQIRTAESDAYEAEQNQIRMQRSSNRAAGRAAGGFLGAIGIGLLTLVCPPAGIAGAIAAGIGATAAIGVGAGGVVEAVTYDSAASEYRNQARVLESRLYSLRNQISSLESQLPQLRNRKSEYEASVACINLLKRRCSELQKESQQIMNELRHAQKTLSGITLKINDIAMQLQSCEFARTRREIAGKLHGIMTSIRSFGEAGAAITYDDSRIRHVKRGINGIENQSRRVLMILDAPSAGDLRSAGSDVFRREYKHPSVNIVAHEGHPRRNKLRKSHR